MFSGPARGGLQAGPLAGNITTDPAQFIGEGALVIAQVAQLSASLSQKASLSELASGLATKEPLLQTGGISQDKIANLQADLGARVLSSTFAEQMSTKASAAELLAVAQSKQNVVSPESPLPQTHIDGLSVALSGKASQQQLSEGLATKASQASLDSLSGVVATKASSLLVETKADQSTVATIAAQVANTYTQQQSDALLAAKQPTITESAPIAQSGVQGLVAAIAERPTTATMDAGLAAKASITSLNALSDVVATKASSLLVEQKADQSALATLAAQVADTPTNAQVTTLLAGKHPLLTSEAQLPQSLVQGLVADIAARPTATQVNDALADKANTLVTDVLTTQLATKASTEALTAGLALKQNILTSKAGAGQSLFADEDKLKRIVGLNGLQSQQYVNTYDANDPMNGQLIISGHALQADIADRQPLITADAPIQIAGVAGLQGILDSKATALVVADSLTLKQNLVTPEAPIQISGVQGLQAALDSAGGAIADASLSIAKTAGLQAALDSKQPLLSALPGTGVILLQANQLRKLFSGDNSITIASTVNAEDPSDPTNNNVNLTLAQSVSDEIALLSTRPGTGLDMLLDGAQFRRIFGADGITVMSPLYLDDPSHPDNLQLKISGAPLQSEIAALQSSKQNVITPSTQLVIDRLTANIIFSGSAESAHTFVAAGPSFETRVLFGGADNIFTHPCRMPEVRLGSGWATLIENTTAGVRSLDVMHDTELSLSISSSIAPSSAEKIVRVSPMGVAVQSGLAVHGNATISGSLVVGSTNILDAINAGGGGIDSNTDLVVRSVSAGGAVPASAGSSAFMSLECVSLSADTIRAQANGTLKLRSHNNGNGMTMDSDRSTFSRTLRCSGGGYVPPGLSGLGRACMEVITSASNGALGADIFLGSGGSAGGSPGDREWSLFAADNGDFELWRVNGDLRSFSVTRSSGYINFYNGFGNVSDQTLKTPNPPEASVEDALAMVKGVSARVYERLDMPSTGQRLGFIAQEVDAACPGAWKNLIGSAQHSTERGGSSQEIVTLDYARLSAVLWQCTRSLIQRVEALEARVQ